MLLYNTVEEVNRAEGIQAARQGEQSSKEWAEADWGYRLRGFGQRGGPSGGWLLTYLIRGAPFSPSKTRTGTLIAYEIDENNTKTGRVGVVRRDWNGAVDEEWLRKIQTAPEWNSEDGPGEDSLERIDALLPGDRL